VRTKLIIAVFGLFFVAVPGLQAAAPEGRVFNVRAIPLGMTMARFRAMPFPDHDVSPTARTFCSDDPGAGSYESLQVDSTLLQAGVVKCGYFVPEKSPGSGEEKMIAAQMDVFGEEVSPLFLFYQADNANDHQLAQITFGMPNKNASALIVLFHRAYGAPNSFDVSMMQMGFGLELANITYVWAGDQSSIKLDTISFVLNQMSVVFVDNRLWGDLHERLLSIENVNRLITSDQKRRREATGNGVTTLDGDAPTEDPNERPGLLPGVSDDSPDPDPVGNSDPGAQ
jgi:hypothetical protein